MPPSRALRFPHAHAKTLHLLGDLRYVEAIVNVVLAGWNGDREQETVLTSFFTFFFERFSQFLYGERWKFGKLIVIIY